MSKNWRNSKNYRKWRIEVIRRDKVCQVCKALKNRQAHHLNHATYFQNERFDVENGITLCKRCHKSLHIDYHRGYRKKCTKKSFMYFHRISTLKD